MNFLSATVVSIVSILGITTLAVLYFCHGHFFYTLDDPYISLSLASNISHGHYGLNASEAASPSSSILYPFVLALFSWLPYSALTPLFVNSFAAAATAAVFVAIFRHSEIGINQKTWPYAASLIVLLCVSINITGVVFTGLEHSLHILTCVAIIFGLAKVLEGEAPPPWLICAIVLAPLWRFEGLALAALAIGALAFARRFRSAATALVLIVALMGLYMGEMKAIGLPILPSSVLVKSTITQGVTGNAAGVVTFLHSKYLKLLAYRQSISVIVLIALAALHPVIRMSRTSARNKPYQMTLEREIVFALVVTGALIGHVLFGEWGWFHRYEIYAVATGATGAIILWRIEIASAVEGLQIRWLIAGAAFLVALNPYYLVGDVRIPLASRGILEQQYQMRRFAIDFYGKPVAVNDLGLVSYGNPNYVLDLWGLGSEQARIARLIIQDKNYMDTLTRQHDVGVAMVYSNWFGDDIPKGWQRLAVLTGQHKVVTAGDRAVDFYATSPEAVSDARLALQRFAPTAGLDAAVTLLDATN
jgi:hypothetical protein